MTDAYDGLLQGSVMIAAFEGWNDAGAAASGALAHLHELWGAEQVDELDPDEYHDFQVNRPLIGPSPLGGRRIEWPTTTVAIATPPGASRQVVLVHGIEPSMRWRQFCGEVLGIARRLDVRALVTVGALLADVPHTRPIPVTRSSEHLDLQQALGIDGSTYAGPTGIIGVLQAEAAGRGIPGLSLWAAVPHYVANPPSPKAALALLRGLEETLGHPIDPGDLAQDAEAWQHGVDELASEDEEIADYVAQLEEAKDTADLPEASGEAIAREFERYLRRREGGSPGGA